MSTVRRLIVNADDFGFTRDVNEGILQCFRDGILRSTTLMANGDAFDDAVSLAAKNRDLDIGCHLVLIGGQAVSEPATKLPTTLPALIRHLPRRDWIQNEFQAQIEKLIQSGIRLTHLDAHKHTHLVPRVLDAMLRVARDFEIPWIRRPFDLPRVATRSSLKTALISAAIRPLQIPFSESLRSHRCRATDYFAGFRMTGEFQTTQLLELLEGLPPGTGEFMCHPGINGPELMSAPTRLKASREEELQALTSPRVQQRAAELGIEFVSFAEL